MRNFAGIFLLAASFVMGGALRVGAQAPANDNCTNATLLTPALACNPRAGTTEQATNSNAPGTCGANRPDVWYRFVATSSTHQVRVDGNPQFDAVIGALTSCGGTGRPAGGACVDATGGDGVELLNLTGLTVGQTYYIQVYDYYGNITASADFDICVRSAPPTNDDCANATLLTPALTCMPTAGTTENATKSNAAGDCDGDANPDVWYQFVATSSTHQVRVDGAADFDAKIGALTSCGGTQRPAGGICTDGSGNDGIEILDLSDLTPGSTYFIQVYDYYGNISPTADFTICILTPPPANDNCANATLLTPAATCTNTPGTTENATGGGQGSVCGTSQQDVWYRFVATATTHQVQVDGAAAFDAVITAWTNCGATVHPTGGNCSDGSGDDGVETLNLSGLTIGSTYYISVYDFYGSTSATADFTICVLVPPPANDNCANATVLTPSATCTNTPGTTENATGGGQGSVCGTSQSDVWYRFVATRSAHQVQVDGAAAFDAVVTAWTNCGAIVHPTGGNCSDGSGDDGVETLNLSGLTIGSTYYISVYDFYGSTSATADFTICVLASATLPLQLTSFTGRVQDHINVLRWETASEQNIRFHVVDRSADGASWREIGRKNGSANSTVSLTYSLEDRAPLTHAYYRLRSVDVDGTEKFSNSIALMRTKDQFGITGVFPAPANGNVKLLFQAMREERVTVHMLDMAGRLILKKTIGAVLGANELPLVLDGLPAGIYTVQLSNSTGTSAPVRLVKQ